MSKNKQKISIVGGCGHVGVPLGLALAMKDHEVWLVDINQHAVDSLNNGKIPFYEEGAEEVLKKHAGKNLFATTNPEKVRETDIVFFVTGTPVDEHHNPKVHEITKVINSYLKYLSPESLVILRSTIYPGVTELVDHLLTKHFGKSRLAFCPERIVQGHGIKEIFSLPQIVSATSSEAQSAATELFLSIAPKVVPLAPKEAEVAKLLTNSWRYLEFAIANQFYMMVEEQGLDFYKIFNSLKDDYPRAQHYVRPGLAAGPCLFKDTMQLSAFHKNHFFLGHSAMLVNEGLPGFLAEQMEQKLGGSLKGKSVAILGMTFKANNDDIRESLSFKLKKILEIKMATVIPSDVFLKETAQTEAAIQQADGVILGVPHTEYRNLKIQKPFVDAWGIWRNNQ